MRSGTGTLTKLSDTPSTSPSQHQLDGIDLKILAAIQMNGRITNVALSERVGITAPPCLRRLRTLEAEGHIRGYRAELDSKRLGFGVTALVFVGLTTQSSPEFKSFEETVRSWPNIRRAYALQGEIDFLLECVARTTGEFHDFMTKQVMRARNVKTVRSAIVIGRPVPDRGLPLPA